MNYEYICNKNCLKLLTLTFNLKLPCRNKLNRNKSFYHRKVCNVLYLNIFKKFLTVRFWIITITFVHVISIVKCNNVFFVCVTQLAQLIVNAGGVAAVVDYVGESKGNIRLPGIMMLGYVAAHSENLAMAVIVSKVKQKIKLH